MSTIFDWVTMAIFGAMVVLFLQRSMGPARASDTIFHYFPPALSALIGLLALLLVVVAGLFGRVVIYAATGRWLQRKFLPMGRNSESIALLLGTAFWIALASLPYIWPLVFSVLIVTSLGLALTARYGISWKQAKASSSRLEFLVASSS